MKMTLKTLTVVGLALTAGAWFASAQTDSQQASTTNGMMYGNGHWQTMMQRWGLTPQMLQRGHMMMNATLTRNDPAAILGLQKQLALTDDQVAKLQALRTKSDAEARALLTADQRTQLQNLPAGPESMAQMYGQMTAHMQQMHGTQSGTTDGATTPCPVFQMMAGGTTTAPTQSQSND